MDGRVILYDEDDRMMCFQCAVKLVIADDEQFTMRMEDEDSGSEYDCRSMRCADCNSSLIY
jgi:RNase P subunit RPR2